MSEILDAVLAGASPEVLADTPMPAASRSVFVRRDEQHMFDGVASSEKDPRRSLHVGDVPVPELAPDWERQVHAEQGWSGFQIADFERLKSEFGVDWVLVNYPQPAGLDCHWHNASLAVCQIPD